MSNKIKLALASDHAGYELKEFLKLNLSDKYIIEDFGTSSLDSVDYPDFAYKSAKSVADNLNEYGVIICGSGVGVSIVANKVKGIRAANCFTNEMVALSRQHNNANVLNIGARLISKEDALKFIDTFINTEFEGGRHQNRIDKINKYSEC